MKKPLAEPAPVAETSHPPVAIPAVGSGVESPPKPEPVREIGGRRDGTEPTRFGDWEKGGRCIDF